MRTPDLIRGSMASTIEEPRVDGPGDCAARPYDRVINRVLGISFR
jgi:hypothetical protein